MNFEKNMYIKLFYKITFTRLVIFKTDNGTSSRLNVLTFNSDIPNVFTNIWSSPILHVQENIDIEYNKRLDRQRPCLEDDLTAGSNL